MRIGYDGKRIFQNFTGLGNYGRYIVSLVSRRLPEIENIVYTPNLPDEKSKAEILRFPQNQVKNCAWHFSSLWRSFGILKDLKSDKVDLFHGLSNELPFGIASSTMASVVTIHDLIFLRLPQLYPRLDRLIYTFKSRYACKNANRIVAVSEQTKADIIERFKIREEKIDIVYQDCGEGFKQKFSEGEKSKVAAKYELPARFILNVGTIESRKNLLLIAKALPLVDKDLNLVVVGRETPYATEVKQYITANKLENRVKFLKNVAYTDLPVIYQLSEIFIYPSKFEGFGIPVLEALYSQVPVIAATGSCLEEAGGPGSLYTDPNNFEQLAELIQLVLHSPEKRREMVEAGNKHLKNFTDEILSAKLMSTYQKALADAKR